jgi:PIN domain nuclease of toxin-antitoxin system
VNVLLDTCAILWAVSAPEKISREAIRVLEQKDTTVFISPISCAEIACLQERNRITLDCHWKIWLDRYVKLNAWRLIDISLDIVQDAFSLPHPFHADPADRIITATARSKGLHLITGDRKLIDYPFVKTLC